MADSDFNPIGDPDFTINGALVPLTGRDVEPISCRERAKAHAIRPGGGCCAGLGAKIGPIMQEWDSRGQVLTFNFLAYGIVGYGSAVGETRRPPTTPDNAPCEKLKVKT